TVGGESFRRQASILFNRSGKGFPSYIWSGSGKGFPFCTLFSKSGKGFPSYRLTGGRERDFPSTGFLPLCRLALFASGFPASFLFTLVFRELAGLLFLFAGQLFANHSDLVDVLGKQPIVVVPG